MFHLPSLKSAVTTLAAATVLVGGAGLASYAATGDPFVLGHANKAGTTTSLKNTGRGPALSLNSAKNVAPLVVNSGKLVKHLNAAKVGGLRAGQLNPADLTYKIGHAGAPLATGQHLLAVPSPKGLYRIDVHGIWSPGSGDSITCLVADQRVLTSMDPTQIYLATAVSAGDSDSLQILGGGFANLHKGNTLITGCQNNGTGTDTLYQPITFTFTEVKQHVKHAPSTTVRNAPRLFAR